MTRARILSWEEHQKAVKDETQLVWCEKCKRWIKLGELRRHLG